MKLLLKITLSLIFIAHISSATSTEKVSLQTLNFTDEELGFIKNNTVKCVTNASWAPFNLLNKKGELSGIAYDYWKLIQKKSGLKSSCTIIENWSEVLAAIKNNKADITLSTIQTKKRNEYAIFSKSYVSFPLAIATRNDFGYIADIKAIESMKIALGKNTSAQKALLQYFPDLNYVETESIRESLELLSTKKVDATVDILPVLAYNMNKNGYSNLKIAGNSNINLDIKVMINDNNSILQSIINKTIETISDEEKQKIYNQWISVKFERGFDYSLFIKIIIGFFAVFLLILYRHKELLSHKKELNRKNTELEKSKKELSQSNKRLSLAAKASFDILYEWDVKTDSLKWYGDIDKLLGYNKPYISQNLNAWLELIHPNDIEAIKKYTEEHRTNPKPISCEYRIKQKDGTYQHWVDHALPVVDENNKPTMWIGACKDHTLAKKREKELIEQSKLASMGEMIGNIAHQWRQPLSIISTISTSYEIKKDFKQDIDLNELFKDMSIINDNAQYLSKTIDDFRNFIRGNSIEKVFKLSDCIDQFLHLIQSSVKNHHIEVINNINSSVQIKNHPNELIQCFINIFNNSKDALKNINEEERYFFISQTIKKNKIIIKLEDNAGGIPKEIINKIFEPYFTTKHQSQGTGIGLSMTYNLINTSIKGNIKASNINIVHNNKSYKGASFMITIPLN